jgi:hypothetical protein
MPEIEFTEEEIRAYKRQNNQEYVLHFIDGFEARGNAKQAEIDDLSFRYSLLGIISMIEFVVIIYLLWK